MDQISNQIKEYFHIQQIYEETQVFCPFHSDVKNKSASINFSKKLFYCFAGCGGKNFNQLEEELGLKNGNNNGSANNSFSNLSDISNIQSNIQSNKMSNDNFALEFTKILTEQIGVSVQIKKEISDEDLHNYLIQLINSKGISFLTLQNIKAEPILKRTDALFGYIKFPSINDDSYVARKFLPDDYIGGERYLNSSGMKPMWGYITEERLDYILVEGIFDYLSLIELGFDNVICCCGSTFTEKQAFFFRGKTVFILFDNDYAGYKGSEKAYSVLRKIGSTPIILDLPKPFGKDVNEAFQADKEEFKKWLDSNVKVFEGDDVTYIQQFDKQESLFTLQTGIHILDKTLNGGFKVGIHGIVAKPTVGKSALALYISRQMIRNNTNVTGLYVTYEIPKKQCWSRLASITDSRPWNEIEIDSVFEPQTQIAMEDLSKRLRIVAMWDIHQITRAMKNYDFLVIDYIQLMPGDSDERHNVNTNMRLLSKLWMDSVAEGNEKVIIIVSTIPRTSYEKEDLSVFKESGNIEYALQSGFLLKDIAGGANPRIIKVITLKNTRGIVGNNFWLEGDMANNRFKEINPELGI